MYTLLLALGVMLFVIFVPMLFGASAAWTVLPGLIIGVLVFVWVNRRIAKRVEAVTQAADAELQGLQQIAQRATTPAQAQQAQANIARHFENAIKILHSGFLFAKWQVGVSTMLNARIGILHFTRWISLQQNAAINEAIPYLERSRVKGQKAKLLQALWPAWAMLAVAYYKGRQNAAKALELLDDVTRFIKKEGVLWSIYAWILVQEKRNSEAIDVLVRGKEAAPNDSVLAENLELLQNNKPLQMKNYGDLWYQFGLERPKMPNLQPKMGHPRMKGRGLRR